MVAERLHTLGPGETGGGIHASPLLTATATCGRCGAPVETGDLFCAACGARAEEGDGAPTTPDTVEVRCEACGARVRRGREERSFRCPFCDSAHVLEHPYDPERHDPEFVVPFAVPPRRAQELFRAWLGRGSVLTPGDLSKRAAAQRMRGVYLPFWSFTALGESRWRARIGEHWYRTETYTVTVTRNGKTTTETRTRTVRETEWWPLEGRYHRYLSGILISASRGLPQAQAEWIEPFELTVAKRYEARFLAGWLSEEHSIARDEAEERCLVELERRQREGVRAFLPGDTHTDLEVESEYSRWSSDLILLPVYLLSYRYRDQVYRFLLNGQTGRAAGERPRSPARIALVVLAVLGALGGLVLLVALLSGGLG
ncbi:MAG: zinc ribbon domain-containing protein [Planctomycetota bacterium]